MYLTTVIEPLLIVFRGHHTMWTSNVMMARIAKHTNQFFGRAQVGPDRFRNRRRTFLMTSHLYGRSRNC